MIQYIDKKEMAIANLVGNTWLVRYPWPVEIAYDQGGEFLVHEFKNSLIENEYGINTNPIYPRNPQTNTIIEIIHQVQDNIAHTYNLQGKYLDDADP